MQIKLDSYKIDMNLKKTFQINNNRLKIAMEEKVQGV